LTTRLLTTDSYLRQIAISRPARGRGSAADNVYLPPRRQGVALLLCLFVLSLVSVWMVGMYDAATVYQSALRNTIEYEQALYLANAGVHHALAELENQLTWRGSVTDGSYPASGSYSATAADGATSGTVEIVATGVSGAATRRVQATVLVE
jgi:Tfp pilus assembly protein PilX